MTWVLPSTTNPGQPVLCPCRPARHHLQHPAIELDNSTSKAAVATVFEKVNTGGLPLNAFELLTATFAGDKDYFDANGTDFRLNDDWKETEAKFTAYPVLTAWRTPTSWKPSPCWRPASATAPTPAAARPRSSAKREDVLKLALTDYLDWSGRFARRSSGSRLPR